jgi:hypothetical protein
MIPSVPLAYLADTLERQKIDVYQLLAGWRPRGLDGSPTTKRPTVRRAAV